MTSNRKTERRQYPRIEQRLPLEIIANGYDLATSTENVSCLGAYCYVEKYIPPFTKIMVRLTLPITAKNRNGTPEVECKGVVVRAEDDKKGGFNLAVFFNDIKEAQKQKISRYLSQFLSKTSPVP